MFVELRSRLTYANVMATTAMFLAMGGGAYALTVPRNSVGTKQVKDYSLLRKDFRRGQLQQGSQGSQGPRGAQGPAGQPGPAGPAGSNAFGRLDFNYSTWANDPGSQDLATVSCDPGMVAVGGGVVTSGGFGAQAVNSTGPSDTALSGWVAWVDNLSGASETITAAVICAPAGTVTKAPGFPQVLEKK